MVSINIGCTKFCEKKENNADTMILLYIQASKEHANLDILRCHGASVNDVVFVGYQPFHEDYFALLVGNLWSILYKQKAMHYVNCHNFRRH